MATTIRFDLGAALRVVHAFLLSRGLAASARALELESGVREPEASDDVAFARELLLDARWAEAEDLLAPLAAARGFDHAGVLFHVRRQRFLELLASRLRDGGGGGGGALDASAAGAAGAAGGGSVLAVVAALRDVEAVCESRVAFNSLCYCLTLPSVNDHPDFADWTPHLGRARAYAAVRRELAKVFPDAPAAEPAARAVPPAQLERIFAQAAALQAAARMAADPRLLQVRAGVRARGRGAPRRHSLLTSPLPPPPLHTPLALE